MSQNNKKKNKAESFFIYFRDLSVFFLMLFFFTSTWIIFSVYGLPTGALIANFLVYVISAIALYFINRKKRKQQ